MDETVHRMQVCVASCVLRSSVEVPVQSHKSQLPLFTENTIFLFLYVILRSSDVF